MAAGVNVAFGHDCVMAPLVRRVRDYMLEVAHMGLHVAQMTSQKGIRDCFDAVTSNAAKVMHLQAYGLEVGCDAQFCAAAGAGSGGGYSAVGESVEGLEERQAAGTDGRDGGEAQASSTTRAGNVP